MGSISIANGSDGRIAILNGTDGDAVLLFSASEAEWWAAQMLFGALTLRKSDTGAVARAWRELAGFGEGAKPGAIDVRIATAAAGPMLVTFKNGTSVFGLHEPAAEAIGLQMIDAVRKARGLEPLAVEKWKQLSGYGQVVHG